jgi:hypothetical protein
MLKKKKKRRKKKDHWALLRVVVDMSLMTMVAMACLYGSLLSRWRWYCSQPGGLGQAEQRKAKQGETY